MLLWVKPFIPGDAKARSVLPPETKTQKRFPVKPSQPFNIPEDGINIDIYLLPAQTVPDALAASFLGIGLK
ncbi:MAG: hypothetical protein D3906_08000, partial [Candidatus Electrothrix sp. AUS1_2]|nr:hypothetical protein [Candidatus Electrothrix sp. AUS1_2]